jgi:hypothetical protein
VHLAVEERVVQHEWAADEVPVREWHRRRFPAAVVVHCGVAGGAAREVADGDHVDVVVQPREVGERALVGDEDEPLRAIGRIHDAALDGQHLAQAREPGAVVVAGRV